VSEQGSNEQDDSHGHVPGLFPVPGDGVLARRADLILLCSLEDSQVADGLLDLLEQSAAAGGDGREFTDAIADALEAAAAGPSVLAFGRSGSGLAVTVSGAAWADVTTADGTARIESGHPSVLLRGAVRSAVSGVRGGLSPADDGVASTDRFSRLDAGTVRAGGLSYYSGGEPYPMPPSGPGVAELEKRQGPEAEPAAEVPGAQMPGPDISSAQTSAMEIPQASSGEAAPAEVLAAESQERQATQVWSGPQASPPVEQPQPEAPAQPFEAVVLLEAGPGGGVDVPAREPLAKVKDMPPGSSSYVSAGPLIQGVYCKNGHFDDPEALFCAICGISMNQQTLVPRPGERPPLGVLLLDDGSVFQLDSDYVLGREPSLDASVAEGKARPLRISDETGIVSRVHAKVHLDGWRVLVTDLGSANGTRVLLPGQQADQPLVPQLPIVLATGSQVDLGGRGFRYESHRGR
jgi:FHA domain